MPCVHRWVHTCRINDCPDCPVCRMASTMEDVINLVRTFRRHGYSFPEISEDPPPRPDSDRETTQAAPDDVVVLCCENMMGSREMSYIHSVGPSGSQTEWRCLTCYCFCDENWIIDNPPVLMPFDTQCRCLTHTRGFIVDIPLNILSVGCIENTLRMAVNDPDSGGCSMMPIGLFVDDRSSQAADTLLDSEDVHSIADSTEQTANEQPEEVEQV